MSGGTDSSVAAMMFLEQGYEVLGVTFRFCEGSEHHLDDARELADRLGIEHLVYDARDIFEEKILKYFTSEYLSGRTPVPCVLCNNYLKWPLLAQIADQHGIYHISTGHYVKTVTENGKIHITAGTDPDKDQSFFLWGLSTELLNRMLLPLGDMSKSEVRAYAARRGFIKVSDKKDSLGVCFCPGDYRDFLRTRAEAKDVVPGTVVDTEGRYLARHEGFPFYTVGQRCGLGINFQHAVFVKEIIPQENKIVLAPLVDMYKNEMMLHDCVFRYPEEITDPTNLICRIRYRKQNTPCRVEILEKNKARVIFLEPLNSIAPGQAAAFYRGDTLLGGGIIS